MKRMKWCFGVAAVLAVLLLGGCGSREQIRIRTAEQLRQITGNAHYILMEDIDLGGAEWTPIAEFKGKLDGNGNTIRNMSISQSTDGNMGLFACLEGSVENLHLENVTVTADDETRYMGLLAGTNRGTIRNCTVTGSVKDERTDSCVGVIAGFNDGGKVLGGTDLLIATAGSSNTEDKAEGLSARVSVLFPEDRVRTVGIVGKTDPENVDASMCWQDTTASADALSETERQRRQTVVDQMYRMGTVRWTPSEEISYTVNDNRKSTHSNVYIPGRTYIGIPYNGCEGAYERFVSQMQKETDSQGRLVTVIGLEDGIKTKSGEVSGFILNMGNDCAGAVIWALAAGVPYSVENWGAELVSAPYMVPNSYNTEHYGVLPVGGYEVLTSDESRYDQGIDARDTRSIIECNGGAAAMAEYYAEAYRGDYLLYVSYTHDPQTDTWKRTGNHARLLAYEPMIVRKWDGQIDLEESYVITHEQGDGLYDNRLETGEYETYRGYNLKQTSWRTDYKYSLSLLLTPEGYNGAVLPGSGYGYVPVTVAAYSYEEELVQFACRQVQAVCLPNRGTYEANYLMTGATMTITDGQGRIVYEKTAYLPYRVFADFKTLKLEELFSDAADSLIPGQTYHETVTAAATGGRTCTVIDQEFTYEKEPA